jgi:hypothetical protein
MYSIHRLAVLMEARCVLCVVFSMKIRCAMCTHVTRFTVFQFVIMQTEWEGIFYRVVFFPTLPIKAGATLHPNFCQRCVVRRGCRRGFTVDDESWKNERSVNSV